MIAYIIYMLNFKQYFNEAVSIRNYDYYELILKHWLRGRNLDTRELIKNTKPEWYKKRFEEIVSVIQNDWNKPLDALKPLQ